jgi:hypothetical protein
MYTPLNFNEIYLLFKEYLIKNKKKIFTDRKKN